MEGIFHTNVKMQNRAFESRNFNHKVKMVPPPFRFLAFLSAKGLSLIGSDP